MPSHASPSFRDKRLREIAAHLHTAFGAIQDFDVILNDLTFALDCPALAEILLEIRALREEEVVRLERLLSRFAANDK